MFRVKIGGSLTRRSCVLLVIHLEWNISGQEAYMDKA